MAGNARYAGPAKRYSDSLDNLLSERGDFSSLRISSRIHGFAPVGKFWPNFCLRGGWIDRAKS